MRVLIASVTVLFAIAAAELNRQQVPTTINAYPSVAVLLRSVDFATVQTACTGAILNNRSALSAARCFQSDAAERWRFRVGSSTWNSGGTVYPVVQIIRHQDWDEWAMLTDIGIVQTSTEIIASATVQPGSFSGSTYIVPDNDPLVTIGWGYNGVSLVFYYKNFSHAYLQVRHQDWDEWAMLTDIGIVQTSTEIIASATVQPGSFSGSTYIVPDNDPLVTIGWGYNGMPLWNPTENEDLRAVSMVNVNLETCRSFYSSQGFFLNSNQLCSALTATQSEEPRDRCFGEPGSPVYHNNVIVGIRSYALSCGSDVDSGSINTRIGPFIDWIGNNA